MSRERLPARAGSAESQASGIRAGGFFLVRLLCLAPLLLATACAPARRTGTEAPNVVLISVDTLRADHLGCYGAPAVETPAIDRLAAEGVRFQHAYSPAPLTLPAHWTIHTGIEPWRHGVLDNGMVLRERPATTLAERFSEAGYDTAAFVAAFVLNRAFGLDRGFRHYDDGPGSDAELDQLFHSTAPADERVSRALHWLRRPRSQPFFLWLHLYDPHSPYEPPSAFRKLYADRPYDGEIAFVDMQLARLLTAIESSPEGVRTLIVLLSDHGESLGEHGELTHGMLLYDATLQVPLIFRLPSRLPAGAARPDAVTLADVAPTVLALAGLPPGEPVDGVDLFGPTAVPARKLGAVSEMPRRRLGWAALAAVREGAWKFILAPRAELFRIADDPRETFDRLERDRAAAVPLEREARRIAALTRKQSETLAATEAGAEEQARIAALGYISGPISGETRGANPRDAIGFLSGLDRANQLLAAHRLDEANAAFLAYTTVDRPPVAAFEGLGRIARLQGRSGDAERYFARLLELDPSSLTALAQLVVLARERGDLESALDRSQKLAQMAPHSASASRLFAEALAQSGKRAEAEAEWQRGLGASPNAGWLRLSLARFLAAERRSREAEGELDRILADEGHPEDLIATARTMREALPSAP